MSNGTFYMHRRGKIRIKILDYFASKKYLVQIQPDIVEYVTDPRLRRKREMVNQ
jgi:hypothetical protein